MLPDDLSTTCVTRGWKARPLTVLSAVSHGLLSSHFTLCQRGVQRGSSEKGTLLAWICKYIGLHVNSLINNCLINISEMTSYFIAVDFRTKFHLRAADLRNDKRRVKGSAGCQFEVCYEGFNSQSLARCVIAFFLHCTEFEFVFWFACRL